MISDKTDDITASRQFNQAIKKLHRYWRTDRACWIPVHVVMERVSIFNLHSDYIRRVKKNQGDTRFPTSKITVSWTDIQHSSRRADAAGALLLVVLLQGFLGLPCLHLLLSADD